MSLLPISFVNFPSSLLIAESKKLVLLQSQIKFQRVVFPRVENEFNRRTDSWNPFVAETRHLSKPY